jgi:hypothetical protein
VLGGFSKNDVGIKTSSAIHRAGLPVPLKLRRLAVRPCVGEKLSAHFVTDQRRPSGWRAGRDRLRPSVNGSVTFWFARGLLKANRASQTAKASPGGGVLGLRAVQQGDGDLFDRTPSVSAVVTMGRLSSCNVRRLVCKQVEAAAAALQIESRGVRTGSAAEELVVGAEVNPAVGLQPERCRPPSRPSGK